MACYVLSSERTERLGSKLWVLTSPFLIWVDGKKYEIPAGFIYDGNSTPRGLWNLCAPASGVYAQSAIPHDWFYSLDNADIMPRIAADKAHMGIGRHRGASCIRSKLVYLGIRLGGGFSYRKKYSVDKMTRLTCYDLKSAIKRVREIRNKSHYYKYNT